MRRGPAPSGPRFTPPGRRQARGPAKGQRGRSGRVNVPARRQRHFNGFSRMLIPPSRVVKLGDTLAKTALLALMVLTCLAGVALAPTASAALIPCAEELHDDSEGDVGGCLSEATQRSAQWADSRTDQIGIG